MSAQKPVWSTAIAEGDNGRSVIVTARRDVNRFMNNKRYSIRIEVAWPYQADANGMPDEATSALMETATDRLTEAFDRDPVAVLTGIYTGDGRRDMVFYGVSTHIFGRKLNEALSDLPLLPIEISCENDPGWLEYKEMLSVLPDGDNGESDDDDDDDV